MQKEEIVASYKQTVEVLGIIIHRHTFFCTTSIPPYVAFLFNFFFSFSLFTSLSFSFSHYHSLSSLSHHHLFSPHHRLSISISQSPPSPSSDSHCLLYRPSTTVSIHGLSDDDAPYLFLFRFRQRFR